MKTENGCTRTQGTERHNQGHKFSKKKKKKKTIMKRMRAFHVDGETRASTKDDRSKIALQRPKKSRKSHEKINKRYKEE